MPEEAMAADAARGGRARADQDSRVPGDALPRLLRALSRTPPGRRGGADARTLADALWLAASGVLGEGAPPAFRPSCGTPEEPEPEASARSGTDVPSGPDPVAATATTSTTLSVRRSASGTTVRGVPLSLGRADPLPDALAVGRAIQPFRRPWLRGGRSELDVEATVEHYARGGPLVPLFRPAPEPWFEVVVLVDVSLSMSVWEETTRAVTRLLTALGGFRAVHTWRLEWQGAEPFVRDHHGREVPGDRVPHHGSGALGRRLVLVFSDCAARGWHTPAPWLLLRDWAHRVPVALVDPLPPPLWRRSALNLPAVQVTGGRVAAHNGTLRFALPRRLGTEAGQASAGPWTALPVVSCTPHLLGAWAATLMRSDPAGCGAVLIPATGRLLPRTRENKAPARRPDPARLAEAFAHTAPAPAVRLAVLCSGLPDLPLPLLHVLHHEVVPEASPSDLAEVLTSGLFTVRREAGSDPVLVFRPAARQYLRTHLTTHDEWRTRAAFGRHAAAHPNAPHGIAAVLHNPRAETELPAQGEPFAEVAGLPISEAPGPPRPTEPPASPAAAGPVTAVDGTSPVIHRAVGQLRSALGTSVSGRTLEEVEQLLRLLIDYAHSRLPAPAGRWPGTHTAFDDLRTAEGRVRAADVADDLRRFLARHGIPLRSSADRQDPAVQNLVMLAADGPMGIQIYAPFVLSWSALASAARSTGERVAAYTCPVEVLVFLDETDREDGFLDLDQCVTLAEWQGDRQGVTVHLRVQTRYSRPLSRSQAAFTGDLRALYVRAGSPSLAELVREADAETPPVDLSSATLRSWLDGRSAPTEAPAFDWLARHLLARADLGHSLSGPTPPDDLTPLRLGHPFHSSESSVREVDRRALFDRDHHQLLLSAVRDCATGTSHMVSLVGPDGSGKTLATLNATLELPKGWWTWTPDEDADPAAVLDDPSKIAPHTVILLDPGERYLMNRSGNLSGERFAAALRRRLSETGTGPVLVLATLLPETWSLLTSAPGPDGTIPHPAARALCEEGVVIPCGATVNHRSESAEEALVAAAVDARRYGHGPTMPAQLLADAARGYLADPTSRPWPEGVSADVLMGMGLRRLPRAANDAGVPESVPTYYRLSEDMERRATDSSPHAPPPDTLWDALATHASGPDLGQIARTAHGLGHPRQAERFRALARSDLAGRGSLARREKQARTLRSRLRWPGLTEADLLHTAEEALAWLRADDHTDSAQHVLSGLLSRTELPMSRNGLPREVKAEAVRHALDWLMAHGGAPYARFVLEPLLKIDTLPQRQALQAVDHTLVWLRRHENLDSAQVVLRPALLRDDLTQAQAADVTDAALGWLEQHSNQDSDAYVLSAALGRGDLPPEPRTRIVAFGLTWLRKARDRTPARLVLRTLLKRTDLTPEEAHLTTALALDWLRAHGAEASAQDVLHTLLERSDLGPELRAEALAAGEERSRTRPPGERPGAGLTGVFGRRRTEEEAVQERIVLVADIVGESGMSRMEQADLVSALPGVLSRVLERHERLLWESEFSGDGMTVVLTPDGVRRTPLVPELLRDLEAELHDHAVVGGLRLRVALHCGAVVKDRRGWQGKPVMVAQRLVESAVLRTALREAPRSPLAAVVSDSLFGSVHFGREHPLAERFRPVYAAVKERTEKAWISVAGYEEPPGIALWTAPRPDGEAGNMPPGRPR
ncbi:SAV_2336 N-terminal domain-related protein [Streptomyces sp. NPDC059452]|uniref:SAV_2336 N-terminal domain-related protein n=1 Tax=Streptomyces sp. NPDC059452 TaxID=3346835 RepID=UPI00368C3527